MEDNILEFLKEHKSKIFFTLAILVLISALGWKKYKDTILKSTNSKDLAWQSDEELKKNLKATDMCGIGYKFSDEGLDKQLIESAITLKELCLEHDPAISCPQGHKQVRHELPAMKEFNVLGLEIFTCIKI